MMAAVMLHEGPLDGKRSTIRLTPGAIRTRSVDGEQAIVQDVMLPTELRVPREEAEVVGVDEVGRPVLDRCALVFCVYEHKEARDGEQVGGLEETPRSGELPEVLHYYFVKEVRRVPQAGR